MPHELGIDANKIIASGGSAGGHLAAATALLEGVNAEDGDEPVSSKPNVLVLFNPVLDLTRLPQRTHTDLEDKRRKQLSPTLHLRSSAAGDPVLWYGRQISHARPGLYCPSEGRRKCERTFMLRTVCRTDFSNGRHGRK